jgi:Tol biopolymer transport system component
MLRIHPGAVLPLLLGAVLILGSATAAQAAPPPSGAIHLIDVALTPGQASSGNVFPEGSDVSADGRFVVFGSHATDLVPGISAVDARRGQIYLRDTTANTTTLISVAGGAAGDGPSSSPSISDDGELVAYLTTSSNIVPGTPWGTNQAVLWSAASGSHTLVSHGWESSMRGVDYPVVDVALAGSGSAVVFETMATDVLPGDPFVVPRPRLYRWTPTAETTMVAYDPVLSASAPSVSSDGRYVAFVSADQHTTAPSGGVEQVYVRDTASGTTELISADTTAAAGNGASTDPALSADGRFVAFESRAADLTADADPGARQIFVHDRSAGRTTLESRDGSGASVPDAARPDLSADGSALVFQVWTSTASGHDSQILFRSRLTGSVKPVSRNGLGDAGNGDSLEPRLSPDGDYAVWTTDATNLTGDRYPAAARGSWHTLLRNVG